MGQPRMGEKSSKENQGIASKILGVSPPERSKEMKRKPMQDFIKENRRELDEVIHIRCPNLKLSDTERKNWVLNDEFLYRWARFEGVRI
jgi:hypothetical protein